MLLIKRVCSDPACAEELGVITETLDRPEQSGCECGYGLLLLEVAEVQLV